MKIEHADDLAQKTLVEIKKLLKSEKRTEASTNPYVNGRERGIVLVMAVQATDGTYPRIDFTFSENRNSDDVVVYTGDFQMALGEAGRSVKHEAAADKMYEGKKFFRTPKKAAMFIAAAVKKGITAALRPASKVG